MRSSGLISGLSSLSCGGVRAWPELLLEVGTMVTITPAGHAISLLGHNGERWVSSLIYSVLSTAHEWACEGWGWTPLHWVPWLSQSCWGCTSSPSPHKLLTLSKAPLKRCVFCRAELGSVAPHCRGVWWQLFGYLSPLAAPWGGSMDVRACNA